MKIAVCVKQVPDSWAEKRMVHALLDRGGVDAVLNDLDEYAVEEALRIVEAQGGNGEAGPHSVTLISMGPARSADAIRKGLSMGADSGILITDDALTGSDALATSKVLAAVIKDGDFDLVFCGTESTDARMSVIPAMLAQRLGWAQLTFAGSVTVDSGARSAMITRVTELGVETMKAQFPAVISVIDKINEPRYPSFKGIMASKKKPIDTRNLATVGVDTLSVGASGARTVVIDATQRPARTAGIKVVDDGRGGEALASFLAEKKFI